jgi:hypothetical protein
MKSLEGFGDRWIGVYVYFELKSPSKSISMTNPSKYADF